VTNDSSNIRHLALEGSLTDTASKSNNLSLKYILKNLLEWILTGGISSQKLRINLYAALLSCLRIVKSNNTNDSVTDNNAKYVSMSFRAFD